MQASAFARYVGRDDVVSYCRRRFREVLVPVQMAADGSFPLELARTKPYGYSLFNVDAMSVACELLSTRDDNLWTWQLADGRGMRRALDFIAPFIADKGRWPHTPDVMHFEGWPIRHISLLLGGLALGRDDHAALWRRLEADPRDDEIIRNYIGRQPLLWVR
jgi:hypothetical protein